MADRESTIAYYVVRNKSTGFYFRGKGANRWGEYFNQASIYRIKAHAENTAKWLNFRGESVEIVRINISERITADYDEVDFCGELCIFADELIKKAREPKWIPVTERLPEKSGFVLVFTIDKVVSEAFFFKDEQFYWANADDDVEPLYVTHWMPLPEPPQEEKNNG